MHNTAQADGSNGWKTVATEGGQYPNEDANQEHVGSEGN